MGPGKGVITLSLSSGASNPKKSQMIKDQPNLLSQSTILTSLQCSIIKTETNVLLHHSILTMLLDCFTHPIRKRSGH